MCRSYCRNLRNTENRNADLYDYTDKNDLKIIVRMTIMIISVPYSIFAPTEEGAVCLNT